jgi:hypothetical protein
MALTDTEEAAVRAALGRMSETVSRMEDRVGRLEALVRSRIAEGATDGAD